MTISQITRSQLLNYVSQAENADICKRIKYLGLDGWDHDQFYFIAQQANGKILGAITLQENPYDKSILWIQGVAVDEDFRRRGLATLLLRQAFALARSSGYCLEFSSYSELGEKYLPRAIARLKNEFSEIFCRDSSTRSSAFSRS
jgi:ribosomal protein S18 acetylase RimI-like enzyme